MGPLIKTSPYLHNVMIRRRVVAENARESSMFEGARHLPPVPQRSGSSNRRVIASEKKAVKGS